MTNTVWPVNAVTGAPSYSGKMLRQTMAAAYAGATAARPLGAMSGVRPGTPTTTVTATSVLWTVNPHAGILDLQTSAAAGPYAYAIDAAVTGAVTAANATNPRKDIVYVKLDDPAEGDGSTVPAVTPLYLAGTAAPVPVAPATPARSMILAIINVPVSGGGSPTVTWSAPYMAAAGGVIPVRNTTERDAADTDASTENPVLVFRSDATAGAQLEFTTNSSTWYTVPGFLPIASRSVHARRGTSGSFASGSFASIQSATLPAAAPAGLYVVSFTLMLSCTVTAVGYLRGNFAGVGVTGDDPFEVNTGIRSHSVQVPVTHSGGATTIEVQAQVSAGTGTAPAGSRVSAVWMGPA